MQVEQLQQRLQTWHEERYGSQFNVAATTRKLLDEVGELVEALISGEETSVDEEAADVIFLVMHLQRERGFCPLERALELKMEVIEHRESNTRRSRRPA